MPHTPQTPIWINLFSFWIVQVPAGYILARWFEFGPQGAFMAITIGESVVAIVAVWIFRQGRWKHEVV